MNATIATLIASLFFVGPLWAADPRIDQAYTLIEQEDWQSAEHAASEALADAKTDIDGFDAEEALATLNYYTQDSAELLPELIALDAKAILLFGREHQRRLPVLELLGMTYGYLGDQQMAMRSLTNLIRIARMTNADPDTLHFSLLNLATLYLEAGDPQTAAILAADLALTTSEIYGPDDEVALEAALVRASAHLKMGHPIEATVHAMPLISLDHDAFFGRLPDLAKRYMEFETALVEQEAQGGNSAAAGKRLYEEAQTTLSARDAFDTAQMTDLEAFGAAIYARDPTLADQLARKLTNSVLADDPFPAGVYSIMILTHLTAGDTADAIPWAKRLAAMPAGYLATLDLDSRQSLTDISDWLAVQGRLPEALEINLLALNLVELREDPHSPKLQQMRLARSALLATARRFDDAEAETGRALADNAAFMPLDPALRAQGLAELGQLAMERKDYASAEARMSEAVALLQSAGLTKDLLWSEILSGYAGALNALGRSDEAIPIYQQSNALREALTGPRSSASVTGKITLAAALANAGRADEATEIFKRALETFQQTEKVNLPLKAALMFGYADVLARNGDAATSDKIFSDATNVSQSGEATGGAFEILALQQMANRAWSQDRLADASGYLKQALDYLPPNDPSVAEIRVLQGRIALETGDLEGALFAFRDAKRRWDEPGQTEAAKAVEYLPAYIETLERLARADETKAPDYLDEIFIVAQGVNSLSAGRALSRAAVRWTTTPALAERMRQLQDSEASIRTLRNTFRERLTAGSNAADIQAQLNDEVAAAESIRRDVAQSFPDYDHFVSGQAMDLASVAAKLRDDEVMVLFATSSDDQTNGESGSIVLAITKEGMRVNNTANRDILEALTHDLRCAAALTDTKCARGSGQTRGSFSLDPEPDEPKALSFDLALAYRAYEAVLEPVSEALLGKTRLIVVPDQSLTAMPFHLLVHSPPLPETKLSDAGWLLRDMSVVVVPTVASFDALRSRGDRVSENNFLGVGDPLIGAQRRGAKPFDCAMPFTETVLAAALDANGTGSFQRGGSIDTDALANLPALPDTRCELQHAARLFGQGSQLLLQADATETRIKALSQSGELASYGNLSFATHGLIAGEVGAFDAGLVLTPPSSPNAEDDGLLTVGEIAQLRLNANFVFLSACNTAAGGGGNDEGLSGLASAFFYAGARSLLVSHWPVYSDAATRLTSDTLSNLNTDPNLGLADALRQAMLGILDDPSLDERMHHPAFWAPFMIVGEGSPSQ